MVEGGSGCGGGARGVAGAESGSGGGGDGGGRGVAGAEGGSGCGRV